MSDTPDYVGMIVESDEDGEWYGVKGMKWGVRKERSQLRAEAAQRAGTEKKSEGQTSSTSAKKGGSSESPNQRYARIQSESKAGRKDQLSDDDLQWFNKRAQAMERLEKIEDANPSWLKDTTAQVLREVAKETMKQVVGSVARTYISEPLVDAVVASKKK